MDETGIEVECERLMTGALGQQVLEALTQAMLDSAIPPIDLSGATGSSLVQIRDNAIDSLHADLACRTECERQALRDRMPRHLQGEKVDLASAILELGTRRGYFAIPVSVFGPPRTDSRVLLHIPSLRDHIDDDGLISCSGLQAQDQGLFIGGYALHYHQFLRREFSGNVNYSLLRVLIEAGTRSGNSLRIGIDDRRIVPRSEFVHFIEEDYWWGPPLTEIWLDDPSASGCTVHAAPEGADPLLGYSKFYAYWRLDHEGNKVVQMEELITPSAINSATIAYCAICIRSEISKITPSFTVTARYEPMTKKRS